VGALMLTPDNRPGRSTYATRDLQRCAERELGWRRTVYRNRVLTGRMTQANADAEIRKMQAIAELLAELAEKERLL
jgi:hypothetical protein